MNKNTSRIRVLTFAWLCLTLTLLAALIFQDLFKVQQALEDNADTVADHVYDQSRLHEVLLKNFATLVSASSSQHNILRNFANEARLQFPHISQFRLYQTVNRHQIQALADAQQARGYEYFIPENFTASFSLYTAGYLYPIVFTNPYNVDTKHLIGKDLRQTSPDIAQLMTENNWQISPIASKPFTLENHQLAYALYHRVLPKEPSASTYIASLVIEFEDVFASIANEGLPYSIRVSNKDNTVLYRSQNAYPAKSSDWRTIETDIMLERFGQQLELKITHQLSLSDIHWLPLIAVISTSCLLFWLMRAYLLQRISSHVQQQHYIEDLKQERSRLKDSVRESTKELSEQVSENRQLVHRMIHIQEQERRYLARELHDELGQSLTAIRTDASILKSLHPQTTSVVYQSAESINVIAEHIYGVTYDMMRSLRPTALDDLGLVDSIRECISNMHLRHKGIEINTDFSGALNDMDEQANITLYRLVQESLTNIVKHANATVIDLTLTRTPDDSHQDTITLIISDDGCGFKSGVPNTTNSSGFGLINMRERAMALEGTLTVNSNQDVEHGTVITAIFPVPQADLSVLEDEAKYDSITTVGPPQ